MPLSPHRPTLAAILVAVVAFTAMGLSRPADAVTPADAIVERATRDLGTWQGECWQWMKKVVSDATGKQIGFDYRLGYLEAGAVEVTIDQAGPGDVVQIVRDSWSSPDADYPGLHTAIILRKNTDGTFDVIDSNQQWDGMVRLRAGYNPRALAAERGLNFHIYRFTTGTAPSSLQPTATSKTTAPGAVGDRAVVNTPGECLNMRTEPFGSVITCLPHGASLSIIQGPVTANGMAWVKVQSLAGTGWVAAQYTQKEPSAAAEKSAAGDPKPVFQYRAVIPLASSD
ncbi:MAG TPA: hypothetical protein PL082_02185 [Tepidiformaceae bacterium]|nr:hypothetical protein [Tepidiformaceae bacterium]